MMVLYYTADDIGVSPMTNPDDELIGNEMVRCEFCTTPYVPALEYMQHMKQLHPGCGGMSSYYTSADAQS